MRKLKVQDRKEDVLPPHIREKKQVTNGEQTGNKVVTKSQQTDNKEVTKEGLEVAETGNKRITRNSNFLETGNKQIAKRITKQITIGEQTGNKQITSPGFETLVGHEKNLLLLLFAECLRTGNLVTPELTLDFLARSLETSSGTVKTVIHRLIKKGFTWREKSKTGRGGWIKFGLEKSLYQDLRIRQTDNKQVTNGEQTGNKRIAKRIAERVTEPSSSSREINLETTITSEEMWKTLDLSVVEKMGINQSAIFEARQKFGPFSFVDFESLIDRFSKYIMEPKNGRRVSNPRAFFFGLCKQMQAGIEPLSEVETETDKAMKEYLLAAKAEQSARQRQNEEVFGFAFEKWFDSLGDDEKSDMVPQTGLVKAGSPPYRALFKDYFEKNLWEETKQTIVKGENIAGNP